MTEGREVAGAWRYRPLIAPIPADVARPRWSVMIPTYNCAAYLRDTLASVLAQDPGRERMEIQVVDDCSDADDPEGVVRELAGDRVGFFRQPSNVGHVANFNSCLQRSRGHIIHLLHGDDQVLPGFYERLEAPFDARPELGAAFCRYVAMDERGHWHSIGPLLRTEAGVLDDWLETIAVGQRLQPPSIVVRRSVYERLGGFDARIAGYGEDWEMYVRIAASYPVWYEPRPLALYRTHAISLSGRSMRTGANMQDIASAIRINEEVLPPDRARRLTAEAKRNNALGSLRRATRALRAGDLRTPLVQLRAALRMSPTPPVLFKGAALSARWLFHAALRGRRTRA